MATLKVLIVHDREPVVRDIQEALAKLEPGVETTWKEDSVSAREALRREFYDVGIFDLTIPNMKGSGAGDPDYTAAEMLFDELLTADTMNPPGDLIGLTRDSAALNRINTRIGPHLMAIVEEKEQRPWLEQLCDRVRYAHTSAAARQKLFRQRYDYEALIVTALDEELRPYRDLFELERLPGGEGAKAFNFYDLSGNIRRGVCFAIGKAGQASAAAHTQSLISEFRPQLCVMTGFCGGVVDKVRLGDVVISESVFDWDFGKWKIERGIRGLHARPEPLVLRNSEAHGIARQILDEGLFNADEILSIAGRLSDGHIQAINIHLKPTGSGSAVVADAEIVAKIRELNEDIVAIDMETYGFYYATTHTGFAKPEMLSIKGVADFCDSEKNDKFHEAASFLSASVAQEVLTRRWRF